MLHSSTPLYAGGLEEGQLEDSDEYQDHLDPVCSHARTHMRTPFTHFYSYYVQRDDENFQEKFVITAPETGMKKVSLRKVP